MFRRVRKSCGERGDNETEDRRDFHLVLNLLLVGNQGLRSAMFAMVDKDEMRDTLRVSYRLAAIRLGSSLEP